MSRIAITESDDAVQTLLTRIDGMRAASRLIISQLGQTLAAPKERKLTMNVREAINELERQSMQALVDGIEPRRPSASRIELEKRAMDAVLQGTEWYTPRSGRGLMRRRPTCTQR